MARCDQGYICDICGEDVEAITDSELYLRFVIGQISYDQLLQSPERHIRCSTTMAQFIMDPDFAPVEVTGDFDKRLLDAEWVAQQESLMTRGWKRLHELKGSSLPFSEYPLPDVRIDQ